MKSNIALIGFMGTGKTSVGQELAHRLDWRLVEVDALIEHMAGKSIPDIFQDDGEIAFREWEIEAIKQVARGEEQVIACGGGVVLNSINVDRLRPTSVIVYLTATPTAVLRRTADSRESRPLLNVEDPSRQIRDLMKFRRPLYEHAADITISTSRLDIHAITDLIIERLRGYEGFNLQK